jgi:hypothetical protein
MPAEHEAADERHIEVLAQYLTKLGLAVIERGTLAAQDSDRLIADLFDEQGGGALLGLGGALPRPQPHQDRDDTPTCPLHR